MSRHIGFVTELSKGEFVNSCCWLIRDQNRRSKAPRHISNARPSGSKDWLSGHKNLKEVFHPQQNGCPNRTLGRSSGILAHP
jgi:hypothetical protein